MRVACAQRAAGCCFSFGSVHFITQGEREVCRRDNNQFALRTNTYDDKIIDSLSLTDLDSTRW